MTTRRRFFALATTMGAAGSLGALASPASASTAKQANPAVAPATLTFWENYGGKAGHLLRADSGTPYFYTGALTMVAADGVLRLADGSTSASLPAAAYQQTDLGGQISFIGAWFRLDATGGRTTHGSGILLGAFNEKLIDASTATAGIHVVIGIDYWAYYILVSGTPVVLANGPYLPLSAGQIYYSEVSISGSTATVITPDGATHTVSDPRISTLGRSWLTTEVVLSAATDIQGTYTALQAGVTTT